tara:strand:- start:147 stop:368 length:222 start_codon:yes stop_codon:yes gene_type:complete
MNTETKYKGWYISHDYQQESEHFDEIDRYLIWSPDRLDVVAEEFKTKSEAKQWIDDNGEEIIEWNNSFKKGDE